MLRCPRCGACCSAMMDPEAFYGCCRRCGHRWIEPVNRTENKSGPTECTGRLATNEEDQHR